MKALTLYDPWATLVVLEEKQYETRSWKTSYRGPLAIHTSKSAPAWCKAEASEEPFRAALARHLGTFQWHPGCIIGVVGLIGCYEVENLRDTLARDEVAFGDYSNGRYAWCLRNVRRLEAPIPCRGFQGLWTVPRTNNSPDNLQVMPRGEHWHGKQRNPTSGQFKKAAP